MIPSPAFTGRAGYLADHRLGRELLFGAVTCHIGDLPNPIHAKIDTGAQWCILPPEFYTALGYDLEPDPLEPRYSTRFGLLDGRLERIPLTLTAEEGHSIAFEGTFFVSPDWPGPPILGWKGCLERIRFAIDPDPAAPRFYFAML